MRRPPSRGLPRAPHSPPHSHIWERSHGYADTHPRRILALHGSCRSRIPARRGRDFRFLPSRLWRRAVAPRVMSGALRGPGNHRVIVARHIVCAVLCRVFIHLSPRLSSLPPHRGMQIQRVSRPVSLKRALQCAGLEMGRGRERGRGDGGMCGPVGSQSGGRWRASAVPICRDPGGATEAHWRRCWVRSGAPGHMRLCMHRRKPRWLARTAAGGRASGSLSHIGKGACERQPASTMGLWYTPGGFGCGGLSWAAMAWCWCEVDVGRPCDCG